MDPQSPPKRMTRSRAAAKAGETATGPKTTKIMTAAAKAKAAPPTTRATAPSKRKTRADEVDYQDDRDQQEHNEAPVRATRAARGRPKKATSDDADDELTASASAAATAPGRATRARAAARKTASDAPKTEVTKTETVKAARGRPKKTAAAAEQSDAPAEPKRTTRGRAATATAAAKPGIKKKVTFEEPEKENIIPDVSKDEAKESTVTGLRGRPVRKPPVPRATRTTKTSSTAPKEEKKTPLSPKKVTQMPHARDDTEDELTAVDKAPVKPMSQSPTKPPAGALRSLKPNPQPTDKTEPAPEVHVGQPESQVPEAVIGSPAKRPPSSPFKDSLKSPAKQIKGVSLPKSLSPTKQSGDAGATTPFKSSMLTSPAKRPQSAIKGLTLPSANTNGERGETSKSPMKASLLHSPAKRPVMPMKGFPTPKQPETVEEETQPTGEVAGQPAEAPEASKTPSRPGLGTVPEMKTSSEKLMFEEQGDDAMDQLADELLQEPQTLQFPGRLSAVLPRYADPSLKDNLAILHRTQENQVPTGQTQVGEAQVSLGTSEEEKNTSGAEEQVDGDGDSTMSDGNDPQAQPEASINPPLNLVPYQAPLKQSPGMFGLREKDVDPYCGMDSESDDELAYSGRRRQSSYLSQVPATPTPAASSRRSVGQPQAPKLGFTPLAEKFSAWAADSPAKAPTHSTAAAEESPAKASFFEDEMSLRAETEADQNEAEAASENDAMACVEGPEFNDILVTDEDMELAAEADEMSLMEQDQAEDVAHAVTPDDVSEASQEYGDENAVPVDPTMTQDSTQAGVSVPPKTPLRVLSREFHTVSKVPLKGADESTPRPKKKKRAASISRLPVSRPSQGLSRSATVISYSPEKRRASTKFATETADESGMTQQSAPATPSKGADTWSAMGTPARTPRRDVNPSLLSGAVVLVDVHTSEGADASGIFVELLNQMGARCVKNWSWNPSSSTDSDPGRIGITHVVYKDGGKRTLEKVRESGGVVQCVGVSWVLDCERENQWLDEAPYYIDTSLVPRGGARRRKSMEPKALSNLNGQLVSSPVKAGAKDTQTSPNTPMNRRDSTVWMHTPSDPAGQEQDDQDDWQLSPVPVTPAPDALAKYAAEITPETPTAALCWDYDGGAGGIDSGDEGAMYSPSKNLFGMQTCPPKPNAHLEMGHGILDREKDEGVMRRLMAARRKSLQFAPKIASPLSKAWN